MATIGTFTRFPALPAELRIQIWTEALTESSVWAAALTKPRNVHDGGPLPDHRSISMNCDGSSPHLVAFSCREARAVMQRIYKRPLRGPIMEATVQGAYWIHLDKAVITFVNSHDSLAILDRFGSEIAGFQHVVLVWQDWTTQPRTCMRLAKSCPALRTVIVQRVESPKNRPYSSTSTTKCYVADAPVLLDLDAKIAARYSALAEYDGPELGDSDADTVRLRKSVLQYFADSPPRLHILAPDEIAK